MELLWDAQFAMELLWDAQFAINLVITKQNVLKNTLVHLLLLQRKGEDESQERSLHQLTLLLPYELIEEEEEVEGEQEEWKSGSDKGSGVAHVRL